MTDVFISYAREDLDLVRPVRDALAGYGLELFFDHLGGIHAGETFPDRIDREVRRAKVVLGCWTDYALSREWVRIECGIAKERDVLVAVELAPMASEATPAMFYYINREPLHGFDPAAPPERWGPVLKAIAQTLDDWADARATAAPDDPEIAATRAKAERLRQAYPDAPPPPPRRRASGSGRSSGGRAGPLRGVLLGAAALGVIAVGAAVFLGTGAPPPPPSPAPSGERIRAIANVDTCGGAEMFSFDLRESAQGDPGQDLAFAFAKERDFLERVQEPSEATWTTPSGMGLTIRVSSVRSDAVDYELFLTVDGRTLAYTGGAIREGLSWFVPCG